MVIKNDNIESFDAGEPYGNSSNVTNQINATNSVVIPPPALGVFTEPLILPAPEIPTPEPVSFQEPNLGFGSYLAGILPDDVAIAAGAFSRTMQQVKNLQNVDFEKFAQIVYAMESTKDLTLVNGTDVPTNVELAAQGYHLTALGSGPVGTYTMSDFFGCMSGLPYPWIPIYNNILALQTQKLINIYDELFLAVTWEGAVIGVATETRQVEISPGPPPVYQTEYRVAGFTIINKGGGYGRGTAPDPIITASNGGSGTGVVGRDNAGAQSLGGGTFGRINSTTVTNQGSWVTSPPTATIEYPPIDFLPVQASGAKATNGVNSPTGTAGWTAIMNPVVAAYIVQANTEIAAIQARNPEKSALLNSLHDVTGSQLSIELRARFIGIPAVPTVIRDIYLNRYPSASMNFVDSLPELGQNTYPHMTVQTLEAISNVAATTGQSIVAQMRESRNETRLVNIGVPLDNAAATGTDPIQELSLLVNGTALTVTNNFSLSPNGDVKNPYVIKEPLTGPNANTVIQIQSPISGTGVGFTNPAYVNNGTTPTPGIYFNGNNVITTTGLSPGDPSVLLPIVNGDTSNIFPTVGTVVPSITGSELDIGRAPPGSLSPSKGINILPPKLKLASGTLPGTFNVPEAIDHVIACNCDCWVN